MVYRDVNPLNEYCLLKLYMASSQRFQSVFNKQMYIISKLFVGSPRGREKYFIYIFYLILSKMNTKTVSRTCSSKAEVLFYAMPLLSPAVD